MSSTSQMRSQLHLRNEKCIRDGPLFFYRGGGGVTFFVKKIVRKLQLAEKNCLLQGYQLKKLSARQRESFWNTLIFQDFDTIGLDIKVSLSFI